MNIASKVLAVAAMALAPMTVSAQELRIGTASLGGAYYPMGQALSNMVNKHAEGYTMVPIVTGGGAENPRLVDSGEVELGIAPASLSYLAVGGKGPYKEALNITAMGQLHSSVLHMVTLPGSGITSIEDLKGKKVAIGPAGGGTLSITRNLFKLYDMTLEDIVPSFLSYADGFSQLSDGNVDAAFALAGFPTSAVMQTGATNDLQFIELGESKMSELTERFPYYSNVSVPADVYNTENDVVVIGSANMLIARGDMDDARATVLLEAIYGNLDDLIAENALAKQIVPKASLGLPIPLHAAAKAYFEALE
ncbi:TAXI family TRAP transporter solute-binding subunit [Planktotalea sp.]|uniref:TAXI family TRAP transporter solute-binding subunit n=1 Tax=Planktotalea sp. TaxID=2029877 RepID=UPI0025DDF348|nr:TAXI family TRAP transporter solute-binding subunit [Planktotalea sp.]